MLLKSPLIEAIARKSGFVQRKSKLSGLCFVDLLVFSNGSLAETSLLEMCQEYKYKYGETLSKQSLDERFNSQAVELLKLLMEEVLSRHRPPSKELDNLLPGCKKIRIKDATSFQLPENLRDIYPGSGGHSSKACLKIQFEYDLKSGKVIDLSIGAYTKTDTTDSLHTIESVEHGELLIRDLGYIGLEFLEKVIKKGAFFLNRIKSNVSIWHIGKKGCIEMLDLEKIEKKMRKTGISNMEFSAWLGADRKVKCRLIVECLSEDIKAEKLRKANKAAKREGRQPGKDTIGRIGLNLFVTNLDEQEVPKEKVWSLYRLRWQIELAFKVWKSVAKVAKIKKVKRERIECYLFGKLLWVFLGWGIFWKITHSLNDRKKAVSFNKMMKNLRAFCKHSKSKIQDSKAETKFLFELFVFDVLKTCMVEKKKKKLSSIDIIVSLLRI